MTTVENNTFTGPNAGVAGGYVPLTTIESTSMDGDLDLVKDDLDHHLSILQAIYIKLDTIEIGATATPSASTMVSTINASAELIDADNLESTVALLSNIISDIEAHRVTTTQSAMHPEDSIKSTEQTYSYTPSNIVTSCQNILDEINNVRAQIHKILGQSTWIDTPNTTITAIKTKLDTIESSAEVNNISDTDAIDLTDFDDSNLHYHSTDRALNSATGQLTENKGGTNIISYTQGDILYALSTDTLAKLPKGTSGQSLVINDAGTLPEWTTIATAPTGIISMWSGLIANIPAGWSLCNGTSGTPDLRAKFIRGAPDATEAGTTGGENEHTLTVAEMPAHTHTAYGSIGTDLCDWDPNNRHPALPGTVTTSSTGGDEAHNNMPAYYEILYIMKV